jgi:hypothetical protein
VPTLLLVDGFRFYFFSNEGSEPPHVHVSKADAAAKLWLDPVEVAYADGFSPPELRRVTALAVENRAMFLARWNEYFRR